jgi:hypothetical protein
MYIRSREQWEMGREVRGHHHNWEEREESLLPIDSFAGKPFSSTDWLCDHKLIF